jgi:hypothetical protein
MVKKSYSTPLVVSTDVVRATAFGLIPEMIEVYTLWTKF